MYIYVRDASIHVASGYLRAELSLRWRLDPLAFDYEAKVQEPRGDEGEGGEGSIRDEGSEEASICVITLCARGGYVRNIVIYIYIRVHLYA